MSIHLIQKRPVIRYFGNETLSSKLPHGNTKLDRPFVRTKPSLLSVMKESEDPTCKLYRNLMIKVPKELIRHPNEVPRDLRQVENAHYIASSKRQLTRDAIYNVSELANDLNFIQDIFLYPDFTVFGFHADLIEVLKGILNRTDLPSAVYSMIQRLNYAMLIVQWFHSLKRNLNCLQQFLYSFCCMNERNQNLIIFYGKKWHKSFQPLQEPKIHTLSRTKKNQLYHLFKNIFQILCPYISLLESCFTEHQEKVSTT